MDKTTMTKSSQSFYAFMAMTMTALSVNANACELNSDFTANACSFAYTSSASDEPILQDKIYLFPKKKNLRERYKRLSQSKWFKKTYKGKTLGEIITVEE